MQRRSVVTAALTLALSLAGAAGAAPNFSGNWKLNIDKSDLGPMPPPTSLTVKVDHADPNLKYAVSQTGGPQGDQEYELKYTTDGKECTNTVGPMEAKSVATWAGDDLAINTKMELNGMQIGIKAKWLLSADGSTLTQTSHVTTPQGEFDVKQVFEKQTR